ncbi:type II toxin-antitoxin system HipA family toxin [Thiothrix lacustris]|uniref:type II toxin-antitoxin system HipA family toxin n=1 Tax=Thiothrix lacustris TaxID=525917 RepID=UPI0027E4E568|nr:HipA domain-containing protein [Thiothrix lacustris]WMP16839.1 HipA domain-containing protein [Thiothrix lacustris]
MDTNIQVYADWVMPDGKGLPAPQRVGELTATVVRNKELFSFNYAPEWLNSPYALPIDPDLQLFGGRQFSGDDNFRVFLDSCPDRWGRLLMKRREAAIARLEQRRAKVLLEVDYLLGVHDQYRMGGLRFKREPDGAFLDNNDKQAAPPISSLRALEYAVTQVEDDRQTDDPDYLKWLFMLISPGSSLGGARPKACVMDNEQSLWIAKFPSRYDDHDMGGWEFVVHQLAIAAGVEMTECRIQRFNSPYHTFLTKRFDRQGAKRLHFTSAMTQLGYYDGDYEASYLELAEFITFHGSQAQADLEQLWRRIVFNIAVSNTDDHLRNHGFILDSQGWRLSPAYDVNPVTPAQGLHLNITESDNRLDVELAMEVIDYFRIKPAHAKAIRQEVSRSVTQWAEKAKAIGISRAEQERMAQAFMNAL